MPAVDVELKEGEALSELKRELHRSREERKALLEELAHEKRRSSALEIELANQNSQKRKDYDLAVKLICGENDVKKLM